MWNLISGSHSWSLNHCTASLSAGWLLSGCWYSAGWRGNCHSIIPVMISWVKIAYLTVIPHWGISCWKILSRVWFGVENPSFSLKAIMLISFEICGPAENGLRFCSGLQNNRLIQEMLKVIYFRDAYSKSTGVVAEWLFQIRLTLSVFMWLGIMGKWMTLYFCIHLSVSVFFCMRLNPFWCLLHMHGSCSHMICNRRSSRLIPQRWIFLSLPVWQVEHPAARHDASLFPRRQRVFALRRNLPAHAHVWTLCVRGPAPGLRRGTPLLRAPRPHRGREYMTHRLSRAETRRSSEHNTELLKMRSGLYFFSLIWNVSLSQYVLFLK